MSRAPSTGLVRVWFEAQERFRMNLVMEFVIVAVIAVLALRGISKPFIGLLALLVVYMVQPGELYPNLAPLHLERTLAFFVAASFFLHGNRFRFPPVTKWFLAFYGAMIVATPFAFWRGNSALFCFSFLEIVVFHLLIVALLKNEERIQQFLITTVALITWLACTSLYLYMTGTRIFTMGIERAEGLTSAGGDPNTLGITLVTAMPLEFMLMAKGNTKWVRLFGLAAWLIGTWTLVITGSRTSFFTMLLMFLLLIVADWRRKLKFLPIMLVLAPALWIVVPQQYKARYETVENLKDDESYQNRVLSWEGGIQMFLHNPVTGIGPDGYTYANGEKYWPARPRHYLNAHSLFFKLLGELGLVGIFTFFGYLFHVFRANHRMSRLMKERGASIMMQKYPVYCQVSLCLLLFTGYSSHNLYRSTWFILGAVTASLTLLQRDPSAATLSEPVVKKKRMVGAWVPGAEPAMVDSLVTIHN